MPNSSLNPTTTNGDIIAHNGSSRVRVAAGSTGYALTASSSESAGFGYILQTVTTSDAMVLISSSTLTADASSISFTSLSSNTVSTASRYVAFYVVGQLKNAASGSGGSVSIAINNATATTSTAYAYLHIRGEMTTTGATTSVNGTGSTKTNSNTAASIICASSDTDKFSTSNFSPFEMYIVGKFNTVQTEDMYPQFLVHSTRVDDDAVQSSSLGDVRYGVMTYLDRINPIDTITFYVNGQNIVSGSNIKIFGIKRHGA